MAKIDDLIQATADSSVLLYQINDKLANLVFLAMAPQPSQTGGGGGGGIFEKGKAAAGIIGSSLGAAAYSPSIFSGVGSLTQGVGSLFELLGPTGMAFGAVIKFGGSLIKGVDVLNSWTRHLMDSNFELAKMSPSMTAVKATQDVRDMMFNLRMGEKLARSTGDVAEAFSHLRETTMDLQVFWKSSLNDLAYRFTTGLERIIYFFEKGKDLFGTKEFQNRGSQGIGSINTAEEYEKAARIFWEGGDPFAAGGGERGLPHFGATVGRGVLHHYVGDAGINALDWARSKLPW